MTLIPIALQLYTVRDSTGADLNGTFSELEKIGYTNVELAGLYGLTASELKTVLGKYGLKAVSTHVGLDQVTEDALPATLESYKTLGVDTLIVPYIGDDIRQGGAGYAAFADKLNSIGAETAKHGFKFGYHNHGFEFQETIDGQIGFDYLIANTDPSLVTFEVDTGWVIHVGQDPVAFINKHGNRISLLHIKDLDPADKSWAPIGTGALPLDGIITAAKAAGVRYLVVEQDTTKGPELEAVKTSFNNLKEKATSKPDVQPQKMGRSSKTTSSPFF